MLPLNIVIFIPRPKLEDLATEITGFPDFTQNHQFSDFAVDHRFYRVVASKFMNKSSLKKLALFQDIHTGHFGSVPLVDSGTGGVRQCFWVISS